VTIEEVIAQLKADVRNKSYTDRGIGPVFQINEQARILLVGQAPGAKVEASGIPFHDKSGETLMKWLGVTPEVFYSDKVAILPMDFYYPGKGKTGDLPPRKFIADEYHKELRVLMPHIELTVLIGKYAMDYYLKGRMAKNLTETVRNFVAYCPEFFPIVHPSPLNFRWQAKNPWFLEDVVPVLKERVAKSLR
jgi:uracil-DNA glycosylase